MPEYEMKEVKKFTYEKPDIKNGYNDQSLYVNIATSEIDVKPVDAHTKETFTGGKGYDLWLLWNAVQPTTKWNDPENEICIAAGPMGGTPTYPGSGKSIVTTLSPTTETVMDSNVGGYFGPYLKFSGFDAMEIQGKSSGDVVVFIDGINQCIQIFESSGLPEDAYALSALLTDHFAEGKPRNVSVVTAGPGAKNTLLGCLNFSWYDIKRKRARYKQAGRGGIGTVFANKGLKALVARWDTVTLDSNKPSDKAALKEVSKLHSREISPLISMILWHLRRCAGNHGAASLHPTPL